jgi:hypothetical protein
MGKDFLLDAVVALRAKLIAALFALENDWKIVLRVLELMGLLAVRATGPIVSCVHFCKKYGFLISINK